MLLHHATPSHVTKGTATDYISARQITDEYLTSGMLHHPGASLNECLVKAILWGVCEGLELPKLSLPHPLVYSSTVQYPHI